MPTPCAEAAHPIGLLAAAAFPSSAGTRVTDSLLHVTATDFAVSMPQVAIAVARSPCHMGCLPFLAPYLHEAFGLSYAAVGWRWPASASGGSVTRRRSWSWLPRPCCSQRGPPG